MPSQLIEIYMNWSKTSGIDPHFHFCALVHAKAMYVSSIIGCHERYGNNAKTKLLNGVVCRVKTVQSSSNNMGAVTMITVNFWLGGLMIKTPTLNSRSVKAGHVVSIPNEGNRLELWLKTPSWLPLQMHLLHPIKWMSPIQFLRTWIKTTWAKQLHLLVFLFIHRNSLQRMKKQQNRNIMVRVKPLQLLMALSGSWL
jgi:hypothetical protein